MLVTALCERAEVFIPELSPKDLALVLWSLARIKYPVEDMLRHQIKEAILKVIETITEEPYLIENENDPEAQ